MINLALTALKEVARTVLEARKVISKSLSRLFGWFAIQCIQRFPLLAKAESNPFKKGVDKITFCRCSSCTKYSCWYWSSQQLDRSCNSTQTCGAWRLPHLKEKTSFQLTLTHSTFKSWRPESIEPFLARINQYWSYLYRSTVLIHLLFYRCKPGLSKLLLPPTATKLRYTWEWAKHRSKSLFNGC